MNERDLICTMTGQQYRAAHTCVAKKDARYYINGIHISYDNTEVVSTNGHIIYAAEVEPGPVLRNALLATIPKGSLPTYGIIFEPVTILKSITHVSVYKHDALNVLVLLQKQTRLAEIKHDVAQHICRIIDGRFPDYKAVMKPGSGKNTVPFNEFRFLSTYLAYLPKMFGDHAELRITMENNYSAAHIEHAVRPEEGRVVLMPVKLQLTNS